MEKSSFEPGLVRALNFVIAFLVFYRLLSGMLTRNLSSLSGVSSRSTGFGVAKASHKVEKAISRRKLHAAVVGAGPAGFYAADELFKSNLANVKVDMFERLPAPYGLVRNGVAPDHPEVKAVETVFHTLALSPQFNFVGNVTVGKDLSVEELKKHYDIVILAYGAEDDKKLGIPGEHLKGVHSARFVRQSPMIHPFSPLLASQKRHTLVKRPFCECSILPSRLVF